MPSPTKHPYQHATFMTPIWQGELAERNDQVCGICRSRYDPALFPQWDSSGDSCFIGHYVLRNMTLSRNVRKRKKLTKPRRRGAKEKTPTFTELSIILADSEPLCSGRPVRLQCGHNFGATCILDTMRRMEHDGHGKTLLCPYCRQLMAINQNVVPAYEAIYEQATNQSKSVPPVALRFPPSAIQEMGNKLLGPYLEYHGESETSESGISLLNLYQACWHGLADALWLPVFKGTAPKSRLGCGLFHRRRVHHRRSVGLNSKKTFPTDPKEVFELLLQNVMGPKWSDSSEKRQQDFARFLKVVLGRAIDEGHWDQGVVYSIPPGYRL